MTDILDANAQSQKLTDMVLFDAVDGINIIFLSEGQPSRGYYLSDADATKLCSTIKNKLDGRF